MSLQLYYSIKCPKSQEMIEKILQKGLRSHFYIINIDKYIERKRQMPKGIRMTPTVHRETPQQIYVYEGDDINLLLNTLSSQPMAVNENIPLNGKPIKQEDTSWQTTGKFEIADNGNYPKLSDKELEAQRQQFDNQLAERLKQQQNDPNVQKWVSGVAIDDIKKKSSN